MSFGRRLALFFVLLVLVPMLALVGVLVIVSEDSRKGKADARLAAGLETALALYDEQVSAAKPAAEDLAGDPQLGSGLRSGDSAQLEEFADRALLDPRVQGVSVMGPAGTAEAQAGGDEAIAFARLDLADEGVQRGALLVSVTSAPEFAGELKRLTSSELVVSREGSPLAATVKPAAVDLDPGETGDVELPGGEYRAHLLSLDEEEGESLLILGPRPDGGLFSISSPAAVLLVAFMLLAAILAYVLARTLTGLHSRVSEQAITDPLTGLWNRRRMDQLLEREVERALRFGHELSVLLVDVDDFKRINDAHGHVVGDGVLQMIANAARRTIRTIDLGARYGGDELALMLLETDARGAEIVADRLRDSVRKDEIRAQRGERLGVTVSIGAATLPDCADSPESLIDKADQALLVAKRAGKDRTRSAPGSSRPRINGRGGARLRRGRRGGSRRRASG